MDARSLTVIVALIACTVYAPPAAAQDAPPTDTSNAVQPIRIESDVYARVAIESNAGPVRVTYDRRDYDRIDDCTTPCDLLLPVGRLVVTADNNINSPRALHTTLPPEGLLLLARHRSRGPNIAGWVLIAPSVTLLVASLFFTWVFLSPNCFAGTCASGTIGSSEDIVFSVLGVGVGIAGIIGSAALMRVDTSPSMEVVRGRARPTSRLRIGAFARDGFASLTVAGGF